MSGNFYFLDTNAIIALLQGNKQIYEYLQDAQWIGISIISQIEFLAFPNLPENDKEIFRQFLSRVNVIDLSSNQTDIIDLTIKLRQKYNLKLPDAVIAATAIQHNAKLITSDDHFAKIKELNIVDFT
jgi:tRNA(fMet)-specific endonuclease VapC